MEDVRDVEDRAQQLKLAAMGRLTASIAHEIRNPLAAISHAGQLLGEDATDPVLKRLAAIVSENTKRLNRLVEDVLRVARREPPLGDQLEIAAFVRQFLEEFVRDRGLADGVIERRRSAGIARQIRAIPPAAGAVQPRRQRAEVRVRPGRVGHAS